MASIDLKMDPGIEAATSPLSSPRKGSLDPDATRLAELGYTQDMQRKFSVWSVLAVGFSLTNSWLGISAGLVTGINSGGPLLIVYGTIAIFLISIGVGVSLAELASAFPSAGGQYYWSSVLASERYSRLASYLTGWIAWTGSVFTSASIALSIGFATTGCYQLSHPDFTVKSWHVVVAYQAVNIVALFFNCYGKTLPLVSSISLYTSLISFLVILITVPASAPTHQNAKFVFATFINNTGWSQSGVAFIVGLVNTNWSFACLDCATHMAEEVAQPERMIPIAIMGTIGIGLVTAWFFGISIFFSIVGNFQDLIDTSTGVPILELFHHALIGRSSSIAGAIILETLIIASLFGCLIASHTWQSRLCWSFARDGGVPFSSTFAKVSQSLDVPVRAHLMSCVIVAAIGCLYLGSYTAFNSIITACIVLLYVSYSIPVVCLLIRGRDQIKRGPFWMGHFGLIANIVLLGWTIFTLVMYSFPFEMPVAANNMNYVSAVYGVMVCIVGTDWIFRGRLHYRGPSARQDSVEDLTRHRD